MTQDTVTLSDITKIQITVGKVVAAHNVIGSKKLIRLTVDFADASIGTRTIFAGVRQYGYTADDFIGRQFLFVTNLLPKKIMGEESRGMILAVDPPSRGAWSKKARPSFLSADDLPCGAQVR